MNIAEITPHLNLLAIIRQYGHEPTAKNSLLCPFHEDKTPSLIIYPHTNTWHCFGCGKGRDALDFIRLKENCSTSEALEKAQTFLGLSPIAPSLESSTPRVVLSETQRIDTLTQAFTYFARSTKAEAKNYLNSRSLNPAQLSVGFDNQSFHKTKTTDFVTKENYQHVGLLYPDKLGRTGSYHSFFSQCIVFPTLNEQGQIINLYGRCIDDTKTNKHRYLPGKHQGIYPAYPASQTTHLILTESIIDCATLQSLPQITNQYSLIALYGVNNFTTEIQTAIQQLKHLKEIILFFDGDAAGQAAAAKHSEQLNQLCPGVKLYTVNTPENEDINSLSQTYGVNTEAFITELLDQRKPFLLSANTPVKENSEPAKENTESVQKVKAQEQTQSPTLNTTNPEQLRFNTPYLNITIWGGIETQTVKKLRVTLYLQLPQQTNDYRDTIDLYTHSQRQRLIREASETLELSTSTLTTILSQLTQQLEAYRQQEREHERQQQEQNNQKNTPKPLNPERKEQLIKLLKSPNLYQTINTLIGQTGVVGEPINRQIMWTVYTSRLMHTPLHIICLGSSGTGKTYLQDSITALIPQEHKENITSSSENALYYIGKTHYQHKLIVIEDMDGVSGMLLPIRELQTKQSISKLVTMKLPNGKMETVLLEVLGPICLSGTTTKERMYEDNANRCILIYLDNSTQHQEAILQRQRNLSAGLIDKNNEEQTRQLLQDLQLLFKPINIINPYANQLIIPKEIFKPLRTNAHYLQFIEAITFVHQYQRPIQKDQYGQPYIQTTLEDIQLANELLNDVLLAKSDELTKACRDFLEQLKTLLNTLQQTSFYRSDIRNNLRINPHNLNHYIKTLHFYGYIKVIGGNKYKGGYEYQITRKEEYNDLKNSIQNTLNTTLQNIKNNQKKERVSNVNNSE